MTGFEVELPRPEWAGGDHQRYNCPIGCRWFHDELFPPRDQPVRLVIRTGPPGSRSARSDASLKERWGITDEALDRAITESAQRQLDTHRDRAHAALVEHIRIAHYGPNVAGGLATTAALMDWMETE